MQVSSLLPHSFDVFFNICPGTSVYPLTIAVVEMDVGIIAASLIVMRPCFEAIRNIIMKLCQSPGTSFMRNNSQGTSSRVSGLPRDKGILRTTEFELKCQPISTREVTPRALV